VPCNSPLGGCPPNNTGCTCHFLIP
jgi:hypothetical protein